MTYNELESILTTDGINLRVKRRKNAGSEFSTARASIGGHRLRVSADQEDQGHVFVSTDSHCSGSNVEVAIHARTEADSECPKLPEFTTLRFSSEEKFEGSVMHGVRHANKVRVYEETTVFLSVSDLLDLRTEINREIRKARRNNINVPKGA